MFRPFSDRFRAVTEATPVTTTSACESYQQTECSTTASAATEIAINPCTSASPYEVSSELVHVQTLYLDFNLYLAMNTEDFVAKESPCHARPASTPQVDSEHLPGSQQGYPSNKDENGKMYD